MRLAPVILAAAVVLTGCASARERGPAAPTCTDVNVAVTDAIAAHVQGGKLTDTKAARTGDFPNTWIVVGKLSDGQVAIFTVDADPVGSTAPEKIQAVGTVAQQESDWPAGKATTQSDGVPEALTCATGVKPSQTPTMATASP